MFVVQHLFFRYEKLIDYCWCGTDIILAILFVEVNILSCKFISIDELWVWQDDGSYLNIIAGCTCSVPRSYVEEKTKKRIKALNTNFKIVVLSCRYT